MDEQTVIWATGLESISDFKPAADRDAIHEKCRYFHGTIAPLSHTCFPDSNHMF